MFRRKTITFYYRFRLRPLFIQNTFQHLTRLVFQFCHIYMNPWCGQYFCVITAHDRYKSYYAHSGKINYILKKQSYLPLKDTSGQSLMLNSPHPAGCIFKNSKYLSHHDHYLYFSSVIILILFIQSWNVEQLIVRYREEFVLTGSKACVTIILSVMLFLSTCHVAIFIV